VFGIFKKRVRKPRKVYVVIDGERKEYVYVDGKYIPKDRIVSVDTANRKVVYVDYDGKLKLGTIPEEDRPVEQQTQQKQKTQLTI